MKVMKCHTELVKIVLAARAIGRLAHFLHRGQEQARQNRDDGDDNEQLNKRKRAPPHPNPLPSGERGG
jgi:hypothetical protein